MPGQYDKADVAPPLPATQAELAEMEAVKALSPRDMLKELRERFTGPTLKKCMATVMFSQGRSWAEIRAATTLSPATLNKCRLGQYDLPRGVISLLEQSEPERWTLLINRCLDELLSKPAKLSKATGPQLAIIAGIAMDKRDALRKWNAPANPYEGKSDADLVALATQYMIEIETGQRVAPDLDDMTDATPE